MTGTVVLSILELLALALLALTVAQLADHDGNGRSWLARVVPLASVGLCLLHAGLPGVVRALLIGAILINTLLGTGLRLVARDNRTHSTSAHGDHFVDGLPWRASVWVLMFGGVMVLPSIASYLHTPADAHLDALTVVVALVLLLALPTASPARWSREQPAAGSAFSFSRAATLGIAVVATVVDAAALAATAPTAMNRLGLSQPFVGLVIVPMALYSGDLAVTVLGRRSLEPTQAIARRTADALAVPTIVAPTLVLTAQVAGWSALRFEFSPWLVVALLATTGLTTVALMTRRAGRPEGLALIGAWVVVAASVWWG